MALITCPDCGKEHSRAAPACIHCGRPNRPDPSRIRVAAPRAGLPVRCPRCALQVAVATPEGDGTYECPECAIQFDLVPPEQLARERATEAREFNPGVAAILSLVIPGAGQMYRGRVGSGLVWLIGVVLSYLLFVPLGLFLHLACVLIAASPT